MSYNSLVDGSYSVVIYSTTGTAEGVLESYLEGLGHTVEQHDNATSSASHASGFDVAIVSRNTVSNSYAWLRDASTPAVTLSPYTGDEIGFSTAGAVTGGTYSVAAQSWLLNNRAVSQSFAAPPSADNAFGFDGSLVVVRDSSQSSMILGRSLAGDSRTASGVIPAPRAYFTPDGFGNISEGLSSSDRQLVFRNLVPWSQNPAEFELGPEPAFTSGTLAAGGTFSVTYSDPNNGTIAYTAKAVLAGGTEVDTVNAASGQFDLSSVPGQTVYLMTKATNDGGADDGDHDTRTASFGTSDDGYYEAASVTAASASRRSLTTMGVG